MGTALDKKRILIADDESMIRDLYMKIMSGSLPDCRVDLAVNGEEAVNEFRAGLHALLLMDIHMPVKDGMEAFTEIMELCEDENIEKPVFIFCTGFEPPEVLADLIGEDSRHVIIRKPLSTTELVDLIKERLAD